MYKIIRAQQEMKVYPQHVDVTPRLEVSKRAHSRLIDFALTQNSRSRLFANSLAFRGFGWFYDLPSPAVQRVLLSRYYESARWNILPQLCK